MSTSRVFLDGPGLEATAAYTREGLAAKLSFEDYVAVAKTLEVDQAFWRCLLPLGAESRGVALVLETRLGALSASLSPHFRTVISWHVSTAAATGAQRRFADLNIKNIRIVVATEPEDIDIGPERLSAIVFYGPGEDLTGQWGDNTAPLLQSLLEQMPRWLTEGGVVVIGENNCCTYRRGSRRNNVDSRLTGMALPGLRRRIRGRLRHSDLYVCRSPMISSHSPSPDFMRYDSASAGRTFPKSWVSLFKDRLLNSRSVRLLWPSFLCVASIRPVRSLLREILELREISTQPDWSGAGGIVVKRIVAGYNGTTVVITGPADRETADVVVRLPSHPTGSRSCRVNALALKRLTQTPLSDIVPRLIGEGVRLGQEFTVESRCTGFEVFYGTRGLDTMVRRACEALSVLHRQTAVPTRIMDLEFLKWVAPFMQDLAGYCSPDIRARLDDFTESLRLAMMGKTVSLGYTHGDFKIGNILFDRSGKLTALIDWDGFSENGFQLFDYLTLLAYKMANESGKGLTGVYLEYLLPWKLPSSYARLVDDAVVGLKIDEDSFLLVRIVFWFFLVSTRFDALYKHHVEWHRRFLLPVLPVFEKICQSGWRRL